jgi:hypothetical protein
MSCSRNIDGLHAEDGLQVSILLREYSIICKVPQNEVEKMVKHA